MLEAAEADPEIDEIEVRNLREDLRRELERISTADITARRVNEARDRPG